MGVAGAAGRLSVAVCEIGGSDLEHAAELVERGGQGVCGRLTLELQVDRHGGHAADVVFELVRLYAHNGETKACALGEDIPQDAATVLVHHTQAQPQVARSRQPCDDAREGPISDDSPNASASSPICFRPWPLGTTTKTGEDPEFIRQHAPHSRGRDAAVAVRGNSARRDQVAASRTTGSMPPRMYARFATIALLGGAAIAAGLATASAGASSAPPCSPRYTTVGGRPAITYCGPATVVIDVGGRTYQFRGGLCDLSRTAGGLELNVGTHVRGPAGNSGKPYVSLLIANPPSESEAFEADDGGSQLFGDSVVAEDGTLIAEGSFAGEFGAVFTGSWNCHGVIYHGP